MIVPKLVIPLDPSYSTFEKRVTNDISCLDSRMLL